MDKFVKRKKKTLSDISLRREDILNSSEEYILHQTNCVSNSPKGLSAAIFKKFPDADCYSKRKSRSVPGKVSIKGRVINLFGQYYPGKPKYNNDSRDLRHRWFKSGLEDILTKLPARKSDDPVTISFPFKIGCGYGGGNWDDYYQALKDFQHKHSKVVCLVMYKLPDKKSSGSKRGRKNFSSGTDQEFENKRTKT